MRRAAKVLVVVVCAVGLALALIRQSDPAAPSDGERRPVETRAVDGVGSPEPTYEGPPGSPPRRPTDEGADAGSAPARPDLARDTDDEDELASTGSAWPATDAGLHGAIGELMPQMVLCIADNPELLDALEGKLIMDVRVEERDGIGRVAGIDLLVEEVDDTTTSDCMLGHVSEIAFDAPLDGAFVGRMEIWYGTE